MQISLSLWASLQIPQPVFANFHLWALLLLVSGHSRKFCRFFQNADAIKVIKNNVDNLFLLNIKCIITNYCMRNYSINGKTQSPLKPSFRKHFPCVCTGIQKHEIVVMIMLSIEKRTKGVVFGCVRCI